MPVAAGLLVAAALLLLAVQWAAGFRLVGPQHTHDGSFAVAALQDFRDAIAQGDLLPRWSLTGNSGLGSPIFFFYPPLAYAVAELAILVRPALPDAAGIAVACAVFRIVSLLSCAAWLRRHTGAATAVLGGAIYALTPYVAFVNPEIRLAFGETAAGAFLPLAFLAVDYGAGRLWRTIAALAPAIAALALCNLPSTVIAGGLLAAYGGFSGPTWRSRVVRAAAAGVGVGIGLGLAGFTIVPAMLLQGAAHFDWLDNPFFRPERHFFFTGQPLHIGSKFSADLFWHVAIVIPAAAGAFGLFAARRRLSTAQKAIGLTLLLAFFFVTPLSRYFYEYLPFLGRIQFPFRFALAISLLGTAAFTLAMPAMSRLLRGAAVAGWLLLAVALCAGAWLRGDPGLSWRQSTDMALADEYHDVPEYLPAQAPLAFWEGSRAAGPAAVVSTAEAASGCAGHHDLPVRRDGSLVVVTVTGCQGPVVLPLFFFPGWWTTAGTPSFDPATGLITLDVPPGVTDIALRRERLPQETLGLWVSLATLAAWGFALAAGIAGARRSPRPA
jgi:hypothetical protein